MGTKHRNLMPDISNYDNLIQAANRAFKGCNKGFQSLNFMEHLEINCEVLSKQLKDGSYRPGQPKTFHVYEPKKRLISALPFRDRVVQQAIHAVISPIFTKTFHNQSYGCINGKGSHLGAQRCQKLIRSEVRAGNSPWVVKTDFAGYFYNVNREILFNEIEKKITCQRTLELLYLFTPRTGRGMQIGHLNSQLYANVYGNILDRWLVHDKKVKNFVRYMDDLVIIQPNKSQANSIFSEVKKFTESKLDLNLSKWSVTNFEKGVNFLGYRIFKDYKLIRGDSVNRAKRKIRNYRLNGDYKQLKKFLGSWTGHIMWADTHNLSKFLKVVAS